MRARSNSAAKAPAWRRSSATCTSGSTTSSAAREHYDRSLEIREEIARQNPSHNQAQRDLALSYNKLGTFHLLQREDPAAARVFYEKALAEYEHRLEAEPENVVAMEDLASTNYFVATAALRVGDRKAAALHYKACLTIREGMPGDAKAKPHNIDLMLARAHCGQHQNRVKDRGGADLGAPTQRSDLFLCRLRFLPLRGALAEEPAAPEAKALARRYTERAFKSLHWPSGPAGKTSFNVQTDPDLDAIRSAAGFEAVVNEYKQAASK